MRLFFHCLLERLASNTIDRDLDGNEGLSFPEVVNCIPSVLQDSQEQALRKISSSMHGDHDGFLSGCFRTKCEPVCLLSEYPLRTKKLTNSLTLAIIQRRPKLFQCKRCAR